MRAPNPKRRDEGGVQSRPGFPGHLARGTLYSDFSAFMVVLRLTLSGLLPPIIIERAHFRLVKAIFLSAVMDCVATRVFLSPFESGSYHDRGHDHLPE